MRAKGNFSDASLEQLHSVSVSTNRAISPSDVVYLESPMFQHITISSKFGSQCGFLFDKVLTSFV